MWSALWRIAVNVLYLGIILIVFASLISRIEVITVALGGLIYSAIRTAAIANGYALATIGKALHANGRYLERHLFPGQEFDRTADAEDEKGLMKGYTAMAIEGIALSVMCLICLYNLYSVLLLRTLG